MDPSDFKIKKLYYIVEQIKKLDMDSEYSGVERF
jgi:hypothetical protein